MIAAQQPLPAADLTPPHSPGAQTLRPFEFRGEAGEYFRIWIVNLALSVLTLGIYSAWATVRTRRYFHANTWLAGSPFEYLADPLAVLRGRAIAVALFSGYALSLKLYPEYSLAYGLGFMVLSPWVIAQSLRFRAHSSAWRGLRFGFAGSTAAAYREFLLMYALFIVTLGLALPYVQGRQLRYVVNGLRYGHLPFRTEVRTSKLYAVYGMATLLAIAGAIASIVVGVLAVLFARAGAATAGPSGEADPTLQAVLSGLVLGVSLLCGIYVQTRVSNLVWNSGSLGPHRFASRLRVRELLWLYLSNTAAIVASLGLLLPWARIRSARYRAQRMCLHAQGELEAQATETGPGVRAAGAELGGFFDVDVSL